MRVCASATLSQPYSIDGFDCLGEFDGCLKPIPKYPLCSANFEHSQWSKCVTCLGVLTCRSLFHSNDIYWSCDLYLTRQRISLSIFFMHRANVHACCQTQLQLPRCRPNDYLCNYSLWKTNQLLCILSLGHWPS